MKQSIFTLFLLLLSAQAFADYGAGSLDMICKSTSKQHYQETLHFKQTYNVPFKESKKVDFSVTLSSPVYQPKTYHGFMTVEDVMVNFKSIDRSLSLDIYLDEMDMAYLYVNGKKSYLKCNYIKPRW